MATLVMIFVLVVGSVSDYIVSYNTPRINVYDTGDGITLSVHCKINQQSSVVVVLLYMTL